MTKAYMILDLQYGSTGKGLLAGYLAKTEKPDVVVTAWGPNAGHTYIDEDGRKFIHRMLANGIVSPNLEYVLIGPGSVIDLEVLYAEIEACADLLQDKTIIIHPRAVVVTKEDREKEARNVKIGSTMKGTGAAIITRIERDPDNNNTAQGSIDLDWYASVWELGVIAEGTAQAYDEALQGASLIQIEGAQGYSLSMYHGFYPYTTSRDVTPAQVMADTAIPFSIIPEIYGTLRTFPIRVSDRFDEEGNMIGTSGPCYWDQEEISWEDVGLEPELTTVTKLPRRIFSFSYAQLTDACFRCSPNKLFLNFANYMDVENLRKMVPKIEQTTGVGIEWVGVGPTHSDIGTRQAIKGAVE